MEDQVQETQAVQQLGTKLTVVERLVLLNILPKEGDFTTIKLLRKLRENLSFDEDEHEKLNFVQDGDQVRWNQNALTDKHIQIGEKQADLIHDALKKLNTEKKLTNEHFSLYEKFVENREE
uniref:Uncharacterized protein n=1 Tax=viral metagenome TaxID=1070528 RepID=A0A6M3X5J4_9ZZZZ